MIFRKQKGIVAITLMMAALILSCSERTKSDAVTPVTPPKTQKQELLDNISIAEGIHPDVAANTGTGNQCIAHSETLTNPEIRPSLLAYQQIDESKYNTPFHRAFWMNSPNHVQDMLSIISESENGQGMLDFAHLQDVANIHYQRLFNQTDGPVLSLLVVIPTADRNAVLAGSASNPGACVTQNGSPINPQPSNLAEWVSECGVRYLEEEKLGQYFLFSATVENLEANFNNEAEQGWADTIRILQVENYTNQTDSLQRLEDFATLYPDVEFQVTALHDVIGGDYPFFVDLNEPVVLAQEFGDFASYYYWTSAMAVAQNDVAALGTPIWQLATVYDTEAQLEEMCGVTQNDIAQAFGCYSYFEDRLRIIERRFIPEVAVYVDALQNPSKYAQPNDSKDWGRFLNDSWDPLINNLPSLRSQCDQALNSANANDICQSCDAQAIDDVIEEFNSLTEPRPAVHPDHPTARDVEYRTFILTNNDAMSPGTIHDTFCGFHRLSGKLEGGGEGAFLRRNWVNWDFETFSQQTANSTRLRAAIMCTDGLTRGPSCSGSFCSWYETCSAGTCMPSQTYFDATETTDLSVNNGSNTTSITPPSGYGLPDKPYLAMFSGMSGKTRGLGEKVVVRQRSTALEAQTTVASQQGNLTGWTTGTLLTDNAAHAFRVVPSDTNDPYESVVSNQSAGADETVELTLAPANQAFCYLTSLGGKFDGAGEVADLSIRSGSWVLQTRSSGTDDCSCGIPFFACGCTFAKPLQAVARCIDIHQ